MIYELSLPNSEHGHLMPQEDAFAVQGNMFVVADGVTRDPLGVDDFTGLSYEQLLETYPQTSGAALAAQLFCRTFVTHLASLPPVIESVQEAFVTGNHAIARLNRQHIRRVDYLVNDYCGCVAAGAMVSGSQLLWGAIGDSGVVVFGADGRVRMRTPNGYTKFEQYSPEIGFDWNLPEGRKLIRSQFRNNPNQIIDGVCVAYGALTGEPTAERFMDFGTFDLASGDLIVAYSDGLSDIITQPEFFSRLNQRDPAAIDAALLPYLEHLASQDTWAFGKERTLVAAWYD